MTAKFFHTSQLDEFNPTKAFTTWDSLDEPLKIGDWVLVGQQELHEVIYLAKSPKTLYCFVEPVNTQI